jgi:hypothetical protein
MAMRRLTFDDLFEGRGTADLRYRPEAAKLDGLPVEIQGVMVATHAEPPRLLLAEAGGDCPDCAPLPVAVIALPGLVARAGVVPGLTRVRVQGTLRVGFAVDAEHYASFVRMEGARAVATSD